MTPTPAGATAPGSARGTAPGIAPSDGTAADRLTLRVLSALLREDVLGLRTNGVGPTAPG